MFDKDKYIDKRPSWKDYFMEIATLVSSRSTCMRRKVGAVIVKNKAILSTGYNGAPAGIPHCSDTGCLRHQLNVPSGEKHELCRGLHAEQNAIIQAAVHGISIMDATLFCTHHPCSICAKMLINAHVETIYYQHGYADDLSKILFESANIQVIKFQETIDI
ncbi:MAG: dCMP deaminase [Candidatus Magnetoglobus multicellularis str. Araruama]|uniref:dCMP deaminase n=1 Tax=Candidatus Magnetoglobus multicellularis str. Araruama TaxID=890399 RepID=A0A1V1P520_9BACT|nr:MAG: dCMP deaminase [Candidatus Magnetoglobus multicellularis str. Araruama]